MLKHGPAFYRLMQKREKITSKKGETEVSHPI